MHLQESIDRLESRIDQLLQKTAVYDGAFREGFEKGVVFALLLLQGVNVLDPSAPELSALRKPKARSPRRGQLDLF